MPDSASSQKYAHIFLVPDEGFGHLIRLHDRLYSDRLNSELRLDIPFIPHLTVGSGLELQKAKALSDQLNAKAFQVEFELNELFVVKIEDQKIKRQILAQIPLK